MKKNQKAELNYPAGAFVNDQHGDSFRNSRGATDISVRDKEWFQEVFLKGERGSSGRRTSGLVGKNLK